MYFEIAFFGVDTWVCFCFGLSVLYERELGAEYDGDGYKMDHDEVEDGGWLVWI